MKIDEKLIKEWLHDKRFLVGCGIGLAVGLTGIIGVSISLIIVGSYFYFLKYGNKN